MIRLNRLIRLRPERLVRTSNSSVPGELSSAAKDALQCDIMHNAEEAETMYARD